MTPNSSILAKPVSVKEYLLHEEKEGRAPPGLYDFLRSTMRSTDDINRLYEPRPGNFFHAKDGHLWHVTPDRCWERCWELSDE